MSVLIYKGDTTNVLGKYLPAPYIEKITFNDGSDTGVYDAWTITVSLFVTISGDADLTDAIGGTGNVKLAPFDIIHDRLKFYVLFVALESDAIADVIDGEMNIFDYWNMQSAIASAGTDPSSYDDMDSSGHYFVQYEMPIYNTDSGSPILDPVDIFYDNKGDQVYKFSYTIDVKHSSESREPEAERSGVIVEPSEAMHIVAWNSLYEYDINNIEGELGNLALLNLKTSDISYERVPYEKEKALNQIKFFDENEEIYNEIPLQSIAGKYHKVTNITHDDLVERFEGLVGEYDETEETNFLLIKMLDNISYILEAHRGKVDILSRLNNLRKVFPSKSSATAAGKLYGRFKKRIFTMNKAISVAPIVRKRLIRNFKIFDERSPPDGDVTYLRDLYGGDNSVSYHDLDVAPSAASQEERALYIGTPTGNNYIYDSSYMGRETLFTYEVGADEPMPNDYNVLVKNYGFFFFDYEKALRYTANVNQIIDISKMIDVYGFDAPYEYFRVTNVELKRRENVTVASDASGYGTAPSDVVISSTFTMRHNYPLTLTTKTKNNVQDPLYSTPSPGYAPEGTWCTSTDAWTCLTEEAHNFLMYRNFKPMQTSPISETISNYHLMCFQFQDFYDDDVAYYSETDEYDVVVEIEDRSAKVIQDFTILFESAKQDLESYYDKAAELFSYDVVTGLFNDFFSEGMGDLYEGDEQNAPWHYAPVIYEICRDMVYNTYGGDMDRINQAARVIIDNINPFNGSFYSLEKFRDDMDALHIEQFTWLGYPSNTLYGKYDSLLSSADSTACSGDCVTNYEPPLETKIYEGAVSFNSSGNQFTNTIYGMAGSTPSVLVESLLSVGDGPCYFDYQCDSGKCGSDTFCKVNCDDKNAIGANCGSNSDCKSNICSVVGKCAAGTLSVGDDCDCNEECSTGACNGGTGKCVS